MSSKPRKRTKNAETDESPSSADLETISRADPLVRSPPKPSSQANVDEYWDLDDDEDWVDGQSGAGVGSIKRDLKEDAELMKRKRILKRGTKEMGIAFVCHLALMCFYIYVHVYDATVYKKNKGKGFEMSQTYGGRWKFLTYWNLWIQFVYFFLCFFTDIMPWGSTKYWFQRASDVMFTTTTLPLSIFVFLMFWGIYFIDRELVYPAYLDDLIPSSLNHFWHTTILIGVLLESFLVFHRYPSNMMSMLVVFVYSTAYIVWIAQVFSMTSTWPYPVITVLPLPFLPVFFITCFFLAFMFFLIGKGICYLRWKERHDLLSEMGL